MSVEKTKFLSPGSTTLRFKTRFTGITHKTDWIQRPLMVIGNICMLVSCCLKYIVSQPRWVMLLTLLLLLFSRDLGLTLYANVNSFRTNMVSIKCL